MKKVLCCFKGGGSNQVVQEPPEPSDPSESSEQTDSSESIISQPPFYDSDFVDNPWHNDIQLPGDRYSPDPSPDFYMSPPLLPYSGELFQWQEILEGTDNLFLTYFLGQGRFGEVYRCNFPRINQVGAVKIQDLEKPSNHSMFAAEIKTLHRANHPNVIKLLGKCFGSEHRAIIYEFLPKGSIDNHLFAHERPGPGLQQEPLNLNWDMRMKIAIGVAEALIYLHKELKIIHGDVKASNVLLDECYVPKLCDFGLANQIVVDKNGEEQQSATVHDLYRMDPPEIIAPETEDYGLVSTKSDVYNYGVFLFTLFTGRKAYDYERPPGTRILTDWLLPVWSKEEYIPLVVDVKLGNRFSVEGINRLFEAARLCIHPNTLTRPDMDFVVSIVRDAAAFQVPELPPVTERSPI